ncbi:MAG: selenium-dependent molybdenum cofactor biosynthesis protein YqeB [Anaerolineae bacterium]|nr:selenium-dependent molybdenum cofactor biosynthesis protein YqeB [Anaerolineae bacterium]MDW8068956.1 selenium-dependent molybdenum cofactor biosynthesis protein YqeB [Anaerolineae bacterium]
MRDRPVVVIKGGGDLGTGVAWRLHRCGFRVLVTEIARPTVIRRAVAFASAVYEGTITVDGVTARRVEDEAGIRAAWAADEVPVVVDPQAEWAARLRPLAVIDAIMAKRNTGTRITDAPIVVALGPGFVAGVDCHAVVETHRGHNLGRVILEGSAEPDTGVPGELGGESARRVLRAPTDGIFRGIRAIGDQVQAGEAVAYVDNVPVLSQLDGVLRGLLHDGLRVRAGMKVGDVDPRAVVAHCFTISDKALAVGGGVLEAVLYLARRVSRSPEGAGAIGDDIGMGRQPETTVPSPGPSPLPD